MPSRREAAACRHAAPRPVPPGAREQAFLNTYQGSVGAVLVSVPHEKSCRIMKSVFRLAARRTGLLVRISPFESAPVNEKRIGLNRCPRRRTYGR
jgi:hypothetical protein